MLRKFGRVPCALGVSLSPTTMCYMSLPLAFMATVGFPFWVLTKIFDDAQNASSRALHGLPADCVPYPSTFFPGSPPSASTALGLLAAGAAGLVSFRAQHALVWRHVFYHELPGASSRSGFRSFALSAAPPALATYLNVFCSAPVAGLVKPLVDGPGPYKHLCAGAAPSPRGPR